MDVVKGGLEKSAAPMDKKKAIPLGEMHNPFRSSERLWSASGNGTTLGYLRNIVTNSNAVLLWRTRRLCTGQRAFPERRSASFDFGAVVLCKMQSQSLLSTKSSVPTSRPGFL